MHGFGVVGTGSRSGARLARALVGLLGALLVVLGAQPLQAKETTSGELAAARRLFADATALEASSDWSGAAAKLTSALAIKETPGLRYHLAHCEEQLGDFVAAAVDYERAAQLIRDGAAAPDVEPLLPLAQRRIDSRVAKLDIVVPPGTSAAAEIDGQVQPPTALGTSIRLDPGAHRVIVRAQGRPDYHDELTLATGEHRTLKVFFADSSAASPSPAEQPPSSASEEQVSTSALHERAGSGLRTGVLVGEAALTAAGLAMGIGYAAVRDEAVHDVNVAKDALDAVSRGDTNYCPSGTSIPECVDATAAVRRYNQVVRRERIGFSVAGAAAGLFVATLVFWPASRHAPAVAISPSPGGVLLHASGSF